MKRVLTPQISPPADRYAIADASGIAHLHRLDGATIPGVGSSDVASGDHSDFAAYGERILTP